MRLDSPLLPRFKNFTNVQDHVELKWLSTDDTNGDFLKGSAQCLIQWDKAFVNQAAFLDATEGRENGVYTLIISSQNHNFEYVLAAENFFFSHVVAVLFVAMVD